MRASATARTQAGNAQSEWKPAADSAPSVGEVAFAVMRSDFAAFLARERGTRLGRDPEELHHMRVAGRRLRAAIALFRGALPVRAVRFRDELGWVAQSTGPVRDLDVELEHLKSWPDVGTGEVPDSLPALRDLLERERERARADLLKALDSPRYGRLLDGMSGFLAAGPLRRSPASRAPIVSMGPDLIRRRYRAVRRAGDRIGEAATAVDYHRLRIRTKRLRYALEFLSGVYRGGSEPLIERLMALQSLLGMQQDADVAVRRLRALATTDGLPAPTVYAMGMVAEQYAQEGRELRARFPKVYAKVRGQPWKELRRGRAARSTRDRVQPRSGPVAARRRSATDPGG